MSNGPQRAFGKIVNSVSTAIQRTGGNSTFYPTTLSQQKSFKKSWLRKQGGVVRSWHRRWFTIKGDQLYYFSSEDESKTPLGSLFLPGYRVNEVPFNVSEPDKFIFEIIPGGDRVASSDIYMLCANSEDDRKDWVRVIRQVMYADKGGAIFGQSLEETMVYESRLGNRKVPEIVLMCVEFLTDHGLDAEGLFRLPGRSSYVKELRQLFDCGERPNLDPADTDVHTVASLLKNFLRDLPEALIPPHFFDTTRRIATIDLERDRPSAIIRMRDIIDKLPVSNYNLLQYLSKFLAKVANMKDVNKMTAVNLGTVFNHSFIRPEIDDPAVLMGTANVRSQIVVLLISECDAVFKKEYSGDGSIISVDTLISFDTPEPGVHSRISVHPSSGVQEDLLGLDFSSMSSVESLPLQQPMLSIDEEVEPYATFCPGEGDTDNMGVVTGPVKAQPDHDYAVADEGFSTMGSDAGSIVSEDTVTQDNPGRSSSPMLNKAASEVVAEPTYAKVNYRVKKSHSFSDRKGYFDPGNAPNPPPRPSKRLSLNKQDSAVCQPAETVPVVTCATVAEMDTAPVVAAAAPSPVAMASSAEVSPCSDGRDDDMDPGIQDPVTQDPPVHDPVPETTPPTIPERPAAILPQSPIAPPDTAATSGPDNEPDPPHDPTQQPASWAMTPEMYGSTEQLSVDHEEIDTLVGMNMTDLSRDALHAHGGSLVEVVRSLRARVTQLETEKSSMRIRHNTRFNELAKKLDVEKASTGEAVDLIVKLQSEIQKYQMHFGLLE